MTPLIRRASNLYQFNILLRGSFGRINFKLKEYNVKITFQKYMLTKHLLENIIRFSCFVSNDSIDKPNVGNIHSFTVRMFAIFMKVLLPKPNQIFKSAPVRAKTFTSPL